MVLTIELTASYFDRVVECADAVGQSAAEFASHTVAAGIEARDRVGRAIRSGDGEWSVNALAESEFNELTWQLVYGARGDDRAYAFDERGKWRELATDRRPPVLVSIELPPGVATRLAEQAALEERRTASDLAAASMVIVIEPT